MVVWIGEFLSPIIWQYGSFILWLASGCRSGPSSCISFALLLSHLTSGCVSHAESGLLQSRPRRAWRPGPAAACCHVVPSYPSSSCVCPRPLAFSQATKGNSSLAACSAGRPAVQRSRLRARLIPPSLPSRRVSPLLAGFCSETVLPLRSEHTRARNKAVTSLVFEIVCRGVEHRKGLSFSTFFPQSWTRWTAFLVTPHFSTTALAATPTNCCAA